MALPITAVRIAVALGLLIGLAGCYETKGPVFGPKDATSVPGLEGRYIGEKNDTEYVVTRLPDSADYLFRQPKYPKDGPVRFRAIALGGDLYLMQIEVQPKKTNEYWHLLMRVERDGGRVQRVVQVEPKPADVEALVRRSGGKLTPSPHSLDPPTIGGSHGAVVSVLRGLAELPGDKETEFKRID